MEMTADAQTVLKGLLALRDRIVKAGGKVQKIGRDAFLFLTPGKNPEKDFAQCGPYECRMYVPREYLKETDLKGDRCIIHGSDVKVGNDYSCGFMCGWPTGKPNEDVIKAHAAELAKGIPGSVTPEQSGLVNRRVRCENCDYHDEAKSECGIFRMLQTALPEVFDFGGFAGETSDCCNANTALPSSQSVAKSFNEIMVDSGGRLLLVVEE